MKYLVIQFFKILCMNKHLLSSLWWADPGWMSGVHQASLSLPSYNWTERSRKIAQKAHELR